MTELRFVTYNWQRILDDLRVELGVKWPVPNAEHTFMYIASEVGELSDALLRLPGFTEARVRNNPGEKTLDEVAEECADVIIMTCTIASVLDIDLYSALLKKVRKLRDKHG